MQAAFVNIGEGNNAFLPFSEISDPELIADRKPKSKNSKRNQCIAIPWSRNYCTSTQRTIR